MSYHNYFWLLEFGWSKYKTNPNVSPIKSTFGFDLVGDPRLSKGELLFFGETFGIVLALNANTS